MRKKQLRKEADRYTRLLFRKLRSIRIGKGISLPSVARAIGLSMYVLDKIEKGRARHLRISLLYRLTEYYRITMRELFEGINPSQAVSPNSRP